MPELPDVEIARRRLERILRGAKITRAQSGDRRVLRPQSPATFARALAGRTVRAVERRGKWLRVRLDDGTRLFSHLGMTGWWVELDRAGEHRRSERARILVTRRGKPAGAVYLDSRRFGRLIVAPEDIAEWRELGPDPLADGIDVGRLAGALARSRRAIKDALMDQSLLAGIGNILATEGLWHARIDPRSPSAALSRADVAKVARGLEAALREELEVRESAEDEWRDDFAVYGRAGQPCRRCGTIISRTVIGGRTTAFCKGCQVLRSKI